jgi:hypothetical protein
MTNLEIIKYLATNNPTRLAELLDDICWFARSHDKFLAMGERSTKEIDDFEEWLNEDASKRNYYYDDELEEWSKVVDSTPTITAFYDGLSVTFPIKDSIDYMWNNNNEYDYEATTDEKTI